MWPTASSIGSATAIEPVTMWFGLRWLTFMAFIAAAMGKEAALGVLASLFNSIGQAAALGSDIRPGRVNKLERGHRPANRYFQAEAMAFI
jgi:ferrous iron transport protein B